MSWDSERCPEIADGVLGQECPRTVNDVPEHHFSELCQIEPYSEDFGRCTYGGTPLGEIDDSALNWNVRSDRLI